MQRNLDKIQAVTTMTIHATQVAGEDHLQQD